ncbi:hypothetical protein JCM9534A_80460 [Catenuloplanes indicus JCM 9534]
MGRFRRRPVSAGGLVPLRSFRERVVSAGGLLPLGVVPPNGRLPLTGSFAGRPLPPAGHSRRLAVCGALSSRVSAAWSAASPGDLNATAAEPAYSRYLTEIS